MLDIPTWGMGDLVKRTGNYQVESSWAKQSLCLHRLLTTGGQLDQADPVLTRRYLTVHGFVQFLD